MDPNTLIFVAVVLSAGAVVGILAGLLGIGGGLILVPVLFELIQRLGADPATAMRAAIATSLCCVIATGLRAAASHHARGSLDLKLVRRWAPAMILGSLMGAEVAARVDAAVLVTAFAVITVVLALNMAFGRTEWQAASNSRWRSLAPIGAGIVGFIAALLGLGVAGLGVPLMTFFNATVRAAVAAAALIGALAAVPASLRLVVAGIGVANLPPWSFGYANVVGFFLIVPIALLCAPLGATLSHRVSQIVLKRIFAAFLTLNAIRMLCY